MESSNASFIREQPSSPPRSSFSSCVKWALGSLLTIVLPFWDHKCKNIARIEGEVEIAVGLVENAAEVVEKVALPTEKMASNAAKSLPEDGKLKGAALFIEHVSKEAAEDAHLTKDIIHKSSSSSSVGRRSRSYKCESLRSLRSTYDKETIKLPTCFCGSYAVLRISWTEKNPGRRFFNCSSYGTGKCEFYQWHDSLPDPWYRSLLLELLQRIHYLEGGEQNQGFHRRIDDLEGGGRNQGLHRRPTQPTPMVEAIWSYVDLKFVFLMLFVVLIGVALRM